MRRPPRRTGRAWLQHTCTAFWSLCLATTYFVYQKFAKARHVHQYPPPSPRLRRAEETGALPWNTEVMGSIALPEQWNAFLVKCLRHLGICLSPCFAGRDIQQLQDRLVIGQNDCIVEI